MANRTIKVYGHNHAADTNLTVSWGGAQVYNGAISASTVDFSNIIDNEVDDAEQVELFEFTYNNADDTAESTHALSITVNSGTCSIGRIYDLAANDNANYDTYPSDGKPPVIDIGGKWYWNPTGPKNVYHDRSDLAEHKMDAKINASGFAINGDAPAAYVDGTAPSGYNYDGYTFHIGESDVFTANVKVAATLIANPNPGKWYNWSG